MDRLVHAATDAQKGWAHRAPKDRKSHLLSWAGAIEAERAPLAALLAREAGKPIAWAEGEVDASVTSLRHAAESTDKLYGRIAPQPPDVLALVRPEPVGVVGAIVPWNFPLFLAMQKVAPALAVGNAVILKCAEQTPLAARRLVELAPDLPVWAVCGRGKAAGRALVEHPGVATITFTGSSETRRDILSEAAPRMKRTLLECGGKCANLVLPSFDDLDRVARETASGAYFHQGQVCCAPSNLIVPRNRKDEILGRIVAAVSNLEPGPTMDRSTQWGPLVSRTRLECVEGHVAQAVTEGARIVQGGRPVRLDGRGFFFQATILDGVIPEMTIAREEVFGPVLSVLEYDTIEEGIAIANGTDYGLSAYLWSRDLEEAHRTADSLRAGFVSVNSISSGDETTPFGGVKQSGMGRERGPESLLAYTEIKTTWIELGGGR